MNAIAHWFTPDVLRNLGLSLVHFLWQGAALAALAAAGIALARQASTRYAIAIGALVLMVAAPVLTYVVLHGSSPVLSISGQNPIPVIAHAVSLASHRVVSNSRSPFASGTFLTGFVELWFVGVLLFSLRTAGGFFIVTRLRRRDSKPMCSEVLVVCREMQQRLGIMRVIRYCESLHLDAPAVVGWFRPVVLLPISALSGLTELQLRAVITHELAHIRRLDAFFNLFQVAAETLLFYHPAVWWLSKRIRAERENCCDDVALTTCGNPAEYARSRADGRMARCTLVRHGCKSRTARVSCYPSFGHYRTRKQPSQRRIGFGCALSCRRFAGRQRSFWLGAFSFGPFI